MRQFFFDPRMFFRTILFYLVATAVWTGTFLLTNEFWESDFLAISGYPFVIAGTLIFAIGRFRWQQFILLPFGVLLIFWINSFVIGPLAENLFESYWWASFSCAVFVSATMTLLVNCRARILFKKWTMLLTLICLLVAYYGIQRYQDLVFLNWGIAPRISIFLIFQTFMIFPLALGISVKEADVQV
ncbi:hypothetical protein ACQKLP_09100 [Chitinophaga sp. NPDC101104]|uniref:hypothetical protein n=1 Tax=Chitinophaga sp. NPDC101104 TaxID=3390561 RepID=UPI003CFDC067